MHFRKTSKNLVYSSILHIPRVPKLKYLLVMLGFRWFQGRTGFPCWSWGWRGEAVEAGHCPLFGRGGWQEGGKRQCRRCRKGGEEEELMLKEAIALSLVFTAKEIFDSARPPRPPWRKKIHEDLPNPFWQFFFFLNGEFSAKSAKNQQRKVWSWLDPPTQPCLKKKISCMNE